MPFFSILHFVAKFAPEVNLSIDRWVLYGESSYLVPLIRLVFLLIFSREFCVCAWMFEWILFLVGCFIPVWWWWYGIIWPASSSASIIGIVINEIKNKALCGPDWRNRQIGQIDLARLTPDCLRVRSQGKISKGNRGFAKWNRGFQSNPTKLVREHGPNHNWWVN